MPPTQRCPQCGASFAGNSPLSPCPACLMQLGLTAGSEGVLGSSDAVPQPGATQLQFSLHRKLPLPTELAGLFPELEIVKLLGHGGMGAVYQARQTGLDRHVALKIIMPEVAGEAGFAERFIREARVLAKLNHPHIVTIHDFGQRQGLHYLIMEYVDGVNLREVLNSGQMPAAEALRVIPPLCAALQYAHDEGIVHRDIKPENILLDRKGRVKIADFGLARLGGIDSDNICLTGTRQVVGTPRYMAPEQMHGSRTVDHRVDLYALGVVFYEMLTGEIPVGRFAPPSHHAALDSRLDDVVLRALESNPDRRYQQAADIQSDVETISREFVPARGIPRPVVDAGHAIDLAVPATLQLVVGGVQMVVSLGILLLSLWEVGAGRAPWMLPVAILLIGMLGEAAGVVAVWGGIHYLATGSTIWLRPGAAGLMIPVSIVWPLGLPVGIWVLNSLSRQRDGNGSTGFSSGLSPSRLRQSVDLHGLAVLHLIVGVLLVLFPIAMFFVAVPADGSPNGLKVVGLFVLLPFITGIVNCAGAIAFLSGGSTRWLKFNTAMLLLPLGFGWLLGLPVGLWSLWVLTHKQTVSDSAGVGAVGGRNRHAPTPIQQQAPHVRQESEHQDPRPAVQPAAHVSEQISVPWSGFVWAQKAVRKVRRKPASLWGLGCVALAVALGAALWFISGGSLNRAVQNGNSIGVRMWLLAGADVNARDEMGMTPLLWACWLRQPVIARKLLSAGADVHQEAPDGETPLIKAAFQGQLDIVEQLLGAGASVNESDVDGETALLSAASEGHVAIVNKLLAYQADARAASRSGLTPLITAAHQGHGALLNVLLPVSQVDATDQRGETALMKAAARGRLAEVQRLLEAKANPSLTNVDGATALTLAIQGGHVAVIELLAQRDTSDSGPLNFWRGFRAVKAGQPAVALPFLKRTAELNQPLTGQWKFSLDDWRYEIVEPKCFALILLSDCHHKLGNTAEAQAALQEALKSLAPGVTNFTLLHRRLDRPERLIVERYEMSTSDISWHIPEPASPWRLKRVFNDEKRGPGRSIRSSGQDEKTLRDLYSLRGPD